MHSREPPGPRPDEAARMLAAADHASTRMITTSDSSRSFGLVVVALMATIISLKDVASGTTLLWLAALFVPLTVWQATRTRKRSKRRPLLDGSGTYGLYAFAGMVIVQCLLLWNAQSGWEIGAKWIVSCTVLCSLFARMQEALDKDRVNDGNRLSV
ncbi:hypothetical protein OK351_09920 [Glutamicibacter sp. MNS18]|uniref:hypothetical protein n=1 Tax=Glutamicibacter sp. MNS18 TaxID=2989817 RepID=UPI002235AFC3|nr:hypothetical protein [Glutamicibacter sp. MNS18]MCW4465820.1 hypothetical protein [Glutamicibacter sp. MNS18]